MITTLEEIHEITVKGKISPDVFWPAIGYDFEIIKQIAALGCVAAALEGVGTDPTFVLAAMQMGACLALEAPEPGTALGVEI